MPASGPAHRTNAWPRSVVDALPFAVAVLDPDGVIVESNRALIELCGPVAPGATCCDALGCDASTGGCCLRAAGQGAETLVALPSGTNAWLTARRTDRGGMLVCLRADDFAPSHPGSAAPRRALLTSLGRMRVEDTAAGQICGPWLEQRPGQMLRFLVAHRDRVVSADEIADALWSDGKVRTTATVRYLVHTLRDQLEPGRERRGRSSFIDSHRGGYRLSPDSVVVDADLFEREVRDGLAAQGGELGVRLLERAVSRHRGDFLSEEPYATWAMGERERLRGLLARGLRTLADAAHAVADLDLAQERLVQLAELEPLDTGVQRDLISLCLLRGRRGEAVRRYEALQRRMHDAYGGSPGFALLPGPGGELAVAVA